MPGECKEIKKVLVVYTGGTIGMQKNHKGVYVPSPHPLTRQLRNISELHNKEYAELYFGEQRSDELIIPYIYEEQVVVYTVIEYDPLYDSSNMSVKDWIRIATDIETYYYKYDGFVILHGTDTLAYTASALSFMLNGLQKPVVLTGSQIPIYENRSDAKSNFLASLIIAACFNVSEVCVYFSNKLFRGNRTAKVSTNLLDAFDSPNIPPLANIGIDITMNRSLTLKSNREEEFVVSKNLNPNVVVLSVFPTITGAMIKSFIGKGVDGVVLQSYGAGNVPTNRKDVLDVFREAIESGVIIVNITQCAQGAVAPTYETGQALKEIGLICGYDMTVEAALTKLSYVLGQDQLLLEEKKKLISINLRGELTDGQ
uniref:asparaginase n=1 Tax=Photinus pyralis TaxID=7054 RepID=A0A1Y1LBV5_PHOPY